MKSLITKVLTLEDAGIGADNPIGAPTTMDPPPLPHSGFFLRSISNEVKRLSSLRLTTQTGTFSAISSSTSTTSQVLPPSGVSTILYPMFASAPFSGSKVMTGIVSPSHLSE